MKNRVLSALLAALFLFLLLPLSVAGADGEGTFWDGTYQAWAYEEPLYGIVICRSMNVRNRASTSGSTYGSIKNGQPVKILGVTQDGKFYVLDLQSCGFTNAASGDFGYAKSSLIKPDPSFFYADSTTDLYSTPWGDGKKNGEQSKRYFLIIAAYGNWYAVQTTESSPGTSFVRSSAVYPTYQNRYVVTWDAPLYQDEYTVTPFRTSKRFELVGRWQSAYGDRIQLVFNEGTANQFTAWISSQYIAPLIN